MENPTTQASISVQVSIADQIYDLKDKRYHIHNKQRKEVDARIEAEVQPLIDQAKRLRIAIELELQAKYADGVQLLDTAIAGLTGKLNEMKIADAKAAWYPAGTVVHKWTQKAYSRDTKFYPTRITGTVAVYDGTQEIASNIGWSEKPVTGDIIVLINRADGSISKKCERISGGANLKNWVAETWLIEGETPDDNILTRREKGEPQC